MIRNGSCRRAQSSVEILGITVLVILGIIVGGPYMVRSINGNFKSLEEGAIDAHREQLQQKQQLLVNPERLPQCQCDDLTRRTCGDGIQCPKTQARYARDCAPLDCQAELAQQGVPITMSECRNEALPTDCCEAPQSTGRCGILANNAPGGRCPNGQMEWVKMCGSPTPQAVYYCQDDAACVFKCGVGAVGDPPPDQNSTACPNTLDNLVSTANWQYIVTGTCNPNNKCEAECKPNFSPQNGGCIVTNTNDYCGAPLTVPASSGSFNGISGNSFIKIEALCGPNSNSSQITYSLDSWGQVNGHGYSNIHSQVTVPANYNGPPIRIGQYYKFTVACPFFCMVFLDKVDFNLNSSSCNNFNCTARFTVTDYPF